MTDACNSTLPPADCNTLDDADSSHYHQGELAQRLSTPSCQRTQDRGWSVRDDRQRVWGSTRHRQGCGLLPLRLAPVWAQEGWRDTVHIDQGPPEWAQWGEEFLKISCLNSSWEFPEFHSPSSESWTNKRKKTDRWKISSEILVIGFRCLFSKEYSPCFFDSTFSFLVGVSSRDLVRL